MSISVMPFRVMPILRYAFSRYAYLHDDFTIMPFCILTICMIPETGIHPSASDRYIHELEIIISITEDCILS